MIIPSIDIMNGKAVQLIHGKEKALEREDVIELALEFRKYGELAVIDLDAAFGKGDNTELIKKICKIADCRVGGGIRTLDKANEILQAGAKKIIIGTKATPAFLRQLSKERVIAAIDTMDDVVVNKGWTYKTNRSPMDLMKELEPYCCEFLFTDVNREGLMKGVDFGKIRRLKELTQNKMTVAGGISGIKEIKILEDLGLNSQLGMSLYTGKLKLDKAFVSLMDFRKSNGLIPTIVQDEQNQVLMLAYSSKASLFKSFRENIGVYYSRSRKEVWTKGETSGNYQRLIRVRFDCDRDALLFTVKQNNGACHYGQYSCFDEKRFNFQELFDIIADRIKNPKVTSYTSKTASSEYRIKQKIKEECFEVLEYKDKNNLVWEVSDLLYFLFILMVKKGIEVKDVENELWRRRK